MKESITRRRFLKVSGITVATPSLIKGGKVLLDNLGVELLEKTSLAKVANKPANRPAQKKGKLDERLDWIFDLWDVPGSNSRGIEGWNESGLWSFYFDSETGEVDYGFFFDYRDRTFLKLDFYYEHKTLSQLRAEGVSWPEINRLHYEGFSNNRGYICFPDEELPAV